MRTFQTRLLIALVLIGTLPLGLVYLGVALLDRQALADQSAQELTGLARGLAGQLDVSVAMFLSDARTIAGLPDIVGMDSLRQEPFLKEVFLHSPQFSRLSTFDRAGQRIASAVPGGAPAIAVRPSFRVAAERGQQAWEVAPLSTTGRSSFMIATPIFDGGGQVVGVLGAAVDLANLSTAVGRVRVGGGGRAFVLDGSGRVVLHPDQAAVQDRRDYRWLGVPTGGRPAVPSTVHYRLDGEQRIAGYAPVPNVGWTVVVERPATEVMAPAESSWRLALIGLASSALLAILAAIVLARTLTRPLRALATAARGFGAGDWSAPLPPMAPYDRDLGTLVAAFAEMRDHLRARTAERERALEVQRFLTEASTLLAASLDYETTFQFVARLAVPTLADWCAVDMVEADQSIHQVAIAHADPAKVELARELQFRYPPEPDAPYGVPNVLRTGQSEFYPEIPRAQLAASAQDAKHRQLLLAVGPRSSMIVPLIARGEMLGAITLVLAESGRRYEPADLALAEELARRAALAVDNARLYRDAQQAVRVRDEFLAVAAHELKTPITSLRGYAQLTIRRLDKEGALDFPRLRQALDLIDEQSHKLARLVTQLLDVSRIDAGKLSLEREVTDLTELVEAVVASARGMTSKHTIVVRAPPTVSALVDPLRLEQVLANLVDNAIKYSPDGGPIDVELSTPNAETVRLAVRDQGIVIPPEHRQRIFDRFYQAYRGSGTAGMGLGLYISRQIVHLHGGKLEAEFLPDGGTCFVVSLPIAPR